MRIWRWIVLLLTATWLVGCNPPDTVVGGKNRPYGTKIMVSLSPSLTELVRQTGMFMDLAGRTASCNYPPGLESVPVVMSGVKPDYEKIAKIKPHVIFLESDLFSAADIEKLSQTGAQIFKFKANSIDEFKDQIYRLGALIGSEKNFSEYADKIQAARGQAQAVAPNPRPKVVVMMGGKGSTEHMVAGTESFYADVARAAGADVVGPAGNLFVVAKVEDLVAQNPGIIIIPGRTAADAEAFVKDPRLASLEAIKRKRIIVLNPDILLRKGSRVDALIKAISDMLVSMQ